MMRRAMCAAVVLATGLSCKSSTGPGGPVADVSIQEYSFTPKTDTIAVGTSVLWTNEGTLTHRVVSDSAVFSSNDISPAMGGGGYGGGTGPGVYQRKFSVAGTYPYHCYYHPTQMMGTIVVTP